MQLLILLFLQTDLMNHFTFLFVANYMATTLQCLKVLIFTFIYYFFCIPGTIAIMSALFLEVFFYYYFLLFMGDCCFYVHCVKFISIEKKKITKDTLTQRNFLRSIYVSVSILTSRLHIY